MITVNDVVNSAYIPYREKAGYIWGYSGGTWTAKDQAKATRDMTVKYGARWIGKRCFDCSGLWVWIYALYGEKIYHGSNTIWKQYCSAKGEIKSGKKEDGNPIKVGSAVFLYRRADDNRHHIGVYIGDGKVIEAKGTINGVVMSGIDHWHEWGELKGVDYSDETVVIDTATTIRAGCKGDAVKKLQEDLNRIGYNCGNADGIFGNKTLKAVAEFQSYYGLAVDGIAGDKTLDKIDEVLGRMSQDVTGEITDSTIVNRAVAELKKKIDAVFDEYISHLNEGE